MLAMFSFTKIFSKISLFFVASSVIFLNFYSETNFYNVNIKMLFLILFNIIFFYSALHLNDAACIVDTKLFQQTPGRYQTG